MIEYQREFQKTKNDKPSFSLSNKQIDKSSFRYYLFASLFDDDDEMSKSISTKQIKNHLYLFASLFDDGVPAAGEAELVEGVGRALQELF